MFCLVGWLIVTVVISDICQDRISSLLCFSFLWSVACELYVVICLFFLMVLLVRYDLWLWLFLNIFVTIFSRYAHWKGLVQGFAPQKNVFLRQVLKLIILFRYASSIRVIARTFIKHCFLLTVSRRFLCFSLSLVAYVTLFCHCLFLSLSLSLSLSLFVIVVFPGYLISL